MSRKMSSWLSWLLPQTQAPLIRGRALLIVLTCLSISAAYAALVVVWIVSGDLDWETLVAWGILTGILAGLVALVRGGRVALSAWIIVGLLVLITAIDVISYGLGEPGAAAFTIPIVFAACALGLWPALGVAVTASAVAWFSAIGEMVGWYMPGEVAIESHLTFNAPAYTVIFVLVALVTGLWNRYIQTTWDLAPRSSMESRLH